MSQQFRKLDEIKPGPIRQQLQPALIDRVDSLRSTLEEVYFMSMAEWLDGFQRDAHPEREVLWWERLAKCYQDYNRQNELSVRQRKAAFNIILKLALGGAGEHDLADAQANLPPGALDEIGSIMRTAMAP